MGTGESGAAEESDEGAWLGGGEGAGTGGVGEGAGVEGVGVEGVGDVSGGVGGGLVLVVAGVKVVGGMLCSS